MKSKVDGAFLKKMGFMQLDNNSNIYLRCRIGKTCIYMVVYADELIIACEKKTSNEQTFKS